MTLSQEAKAQGGQDAIAMCEALREEYGRHRTQSESVIEHLKKAAADVAAENEGLRAQLQVRVLALSVVTRWSRVALRGVVSVVSNDGSMRMTSF